MAKRITEFYQDGIYHLYNRGVDGRKIFLADQNYLFFSQRLLQYSSELSISTLAYCLMPTIFIYWSSKMENVQQESSVKGFVIAIQKRSITRSIEQVHCSNLNLKPSMSIRKNTCFRSRATFMPIQ